MSKNKNGPTQVWLCGDCADFNEAELRYECRKRQGKAPRKLKGMIVGVCGHIITPEWCPIKDEHGS